MRRKVTLMEMQNLVAAWPSRQPAKRKRTVALSGQQVAELVTQWPDAAPAPVMIATRASTTTSARNAVLVSFGTKLPRLASNITTLQHLSNALAIVIVVIDESAKCAVFAPQRAASSNPVHVVLQQQGVQYFLLQVQGVTQFQEDALLPKFRACIQNAPRK